MPKVLKSHLRFQSQERLMSLFLKGVISLILKPLLPINNTNSLGPGLSPKHAMGTATQPWKREWEQSWQIWVWHLGLLPEWDPMRQVGSEISRIHRRLLQHKCPKTFLVSRKPIKLAQSFLPNSTPREPHGNMDLAWNSAPFLLLFPLCFLCQGHPHAWEDLTWHQISTHLQRSPGAELAILAVMHF